MEDSIDWKALAVRLGTLREDGESGGSEQARQALELLLGEERLRHTVDYYISGGPGSELARSVLWLIRPWSAMKYCYEIYYTEWDTDTRRMAVELLRVVADKRALGWVAEFLADEDPFIQSCGVGVVDQLLFTGLVEAADAEQLLAQAETHENMHVREQAALIRESVSRSARREAERKDE